MCDNEIFIGPFTGVGAVKRLRDASATFIIRDAMRQHHYGFTSIDGRNEWANKHRDNKLMALHEVVCGRNPIAAFIDIDALPDATDAELDSILCAFKKVGHEYDDGFCIRRMLSCDRPKKRSRHVIGSYIFKNADDLSAFTDKIKALLSDRIAAWVDNICTPKSFGLRLPFTAKCKGDSSTLSPVPRTSDDDDMGLYFIQNSYVQPSDPVYPSVAFVEASGQLGAMQDMIKKDMPWFKPKRDYIPDGDIIASYNRVEPRYCKTCFRVHDSIGAYVRKTDNVLELKCPHTLENHRYLLRILPPREVKNDEHMDLKADVEIDEQYVSNALDMSVNASLVIRSPYNTGKTRPIHERISILRKNNPDAIIIGVTGRVAVTHQEAVSLNLTHYKEVDGELNPLVTSGSIWQIDSFSRAAAYFAKHPQMRPDLIFIDEYQAIVEHVYGKVGDTRSIKARQDSLCALDRLITVAKQVIVLDNNISDVDVKDVLSRLCPDIMSVRNKYQPFKGRKARITGSSNTVKQKMWDFLDTQYGNIKEGRAYQSCVVPCHSKATAKSLAEAAVQRYGEGRVKCYTGDSDDYMKTNDFKDVNAAWKDILVVFYTSTVTVGVNCTLPNFTRVFALFHTGNASYVQSEQMLFRARMLKEVDIAISGPVGGCYPVTEDELYAWLTHANNFRNYMPDSYSDPTNITVPVNISKDPELMRSCLNNPRGRRVVTFLLNMFRSKYAFRKLLCADLEGYGMELDEQEDVVLASANKRDENDAAVVVSDREHTQQAENYKDALNNIDDDTYRLKDEAEKQGDKGALTVKAFNMQSSRQSLSPEWFSFYNEHVQSCRNLWSIKISKTQSVPGITSHNEQATIINRIAEILDAKLLRTPGESFTIPIVLIEKFITTEAKSYATDINNRSGRVFGDRHAARRRKLKTPIKFVKAVYSVALSHVGAKISPHFIDDKARNRNNYNSFEITWPWHEKDAPEPIPLHPTGSVQDQDDASYQVLYAELPGMKPNPLPGINEAEVHPIYFATPTKCYRDVDPELAEYVKRTSFVKRK